MDRKYRQHGYMDKEKEKVEKSKGQAPSRPRSETFGPRALNMPNCAFASPAAPSAVMFSRISPPIPTVAQNADSPCTPASNARISIPAAVLNAASRSPIASRRRMSPILVRFTRFA